MFRDQKGYDPSTQQYHNPSPYSKVKLPYLNLYLFRFPGQFRKIMVSFKRNTKYDLQTLFFQFLALDKLWIITYLASRSTRYYTSEPPLSALNVTPSFNTEKRHLVGKLLSLIECVLPNQRQLSRVRYQIYSKFRGKLSASWPLLPLP